MEPPSDGIPRQAWCGRQLDVDAMRCASDQIRILLARSSEGRLDITSCHLAPLRVPVTSSPSQSSVASLCVTLWICTSFNSSFVNMARS